MIKNLIKKLKSLVKKISGEAEYQKYLKHYKKHHTQKPHSHKPLTKQEFFAKKEDGKWQKVNRCC